MDYTYTCLIKWIHLLAGVSLLSGLLKLGSSPASALSVTTERGQKMPLDQPRVLRKRRDLIIIEILGTPFSKKTFVVPVDSSYILQRSVGSVGTDFI